MPVTATIPPVPTHEVFDGLRQQIEKTAAHSTDRQFGVFCLEKRRTWKKHATLLSSDLGEPTKKLSAVERAQKRHLEAAGVSGDDVVAVVAWFDKAIEACRVALAGAA